MKNITLIIFLSLISINSFATNAPTPPSSGFMSFLPLIFIFVIFYFLLIRPQHKKIKLHEKMVQSLKIGNEICTNSGIFGKIYKIDDKNNIILLEISKNINIKIKKNSISEIFNKKNMNGPKLIGKSQKNNRNIKK